MNIMQLKVSSVLHFLSYFIKNTKEREWDLGAQPVSFTSGAPDVLWWYAFKT